MVADGEPEPGSSESWVLSSGAPTCGTVFVGRTAPPGSATPGKSPLPCSGVPSSSRSGEVTGVSRGGTGATSVVGIVEVVVDEVLVEVGLGILVVDVSAADLAETPALAPTAVTPRSNTPVATTAAVPPAPRRFITLLSLFMATSPFGWKLLPLSK